MGIRQANFNGTSSSSRNLIRVPARQLKRHLEKRSSLNSRATIRAVLVAKRACRRGPLDKTSANACEWQQTHQGPERRERWFEGAGGNQLDSRISHEADCGAQIRLQHWIANDAETGGLAQNYCLGHVGLLSYLCAQGISILKLPFIN